MPLFQSVHHGLGDFIGPRPIMGDVTIAEIVLRVIVHPSHGLVQQLAD
jgi:hypothetical protein